MVEGAEKILGRGGLIRLRGSLDGLYVQWQSKKTYHREARKGFAKC